MAQRGPVYLYCLGCGSDLSTTPRGRRDIGENSLTTPEPRNRILILWNRMSKPEVDKQNISSSLSLWEVQQKHHSRLRSTHFVPESFGSNSSGISNVHLDQRHSVSMIIIFTKC